MWADRSTDALFPVGDISQLAPELAGRDGVGVGQVGARVVLNPTT